MTVDQWLNIEQLFDLQRGRCPVRARLSIDRCRGCERKAGEGYGQLMDEWPGQLGGFVAHDRIQFQGNATNSAIGH